jgi:hypothetical protein
MVQRRHWRGTEYSDEAVRETTMIWLIIDVHGYPVDAFTDESLARETLAKRADRSLRLLRMFITRREAAVIGGVVQ